MGAHIWVEKQNPRMPSDAWVAASLGRLRQVASAKNKVQVEPFIKALYSF